MILREHGYKMGVLNEFQQITIIKINNIMTDKWILFNNVNLFIILQLNT